MKPLSGKFLLLFLLLVAAVHPVRAQHWLKTMQAAQRAAARAEKQYAANVQNALRQSVARAEAVNEALHSNSRGAASLTRSYPIQELITEGMPRTLTGWSLLENKLITVQRIRRESRLRTLERERTSWIKHLKHQNRLQPEQLAEYIPAHAKYVFLGEYHHYPALRETLQQTVVQYRRLHPDKQVLVFSEFIQDAYPHFKKPNTVTRFYADGFYRENLPVAGLLEEPPLQLYSVSDGLGQDPQETLLGMKTRNEHWRDMLLRWRQQYPDAVFFIHAGNGHVGYHEPFAVSLDFPAGETFVLQFSPAHFSSETLAQYEMFHAFTRAEFYKPGVLFWTSRRAARLSGFDAQVILPIPPKDFFR